MAMIKHETTNMAVRDIQKYHDALDKVSFGCCFCVTSESGLNVCNNTFCVGFAQISWPENIRDQ